MFQIGTRRPHFYFSLYCRGQQWSLAGIVLMTIGICLLLTYTVTAAKNVSNFTFLVIFHVPSFQLFSVCFLFFSLYVCTFMIKCLTSSAADPRCLLDQNFSPFDFHGIFEKKKDFVPPPFREILDPPLHIFQFCCTIQLIQYKSVL